MSDLDVAIKQATQYSSEIPNVNVTAYEDLRDEIGKYLSGELALDQLSKEAMWIVIDGSYPEDYFPEDDHLQCDDYEASRAEYMEDR